jgi:hypothetical protein
MTSGNGSDRESNAIGTEISHAIDAEISAPADASVDRSIDVDFSAPLADLPPPRELDPVVLDHDPEDFLRIVANPFLAFALIAFWFALLIGSMIFLSAHPFTIFVGAAFLFWFGGKIVQSFRYHCLDCGGSGPLNAWPVHNCPISAERRRSGKRRRFHGPEPGVQVLIWLVAATFGAIFAGALIFNR